MNERAGCDLPDGDGVQKLLVGQPAEAHHQVGAQESQQHIAAAVQHRADLKKGQEQQSQAEGTLAAAAAVGSRQACPSASSQQAALARCLAQASQVTHQHHQQPAAEEQQRAR